MWATVLVMIMQLGTLILVAWATREFGTDHTFVVSVREPPCRWAGPPEGQLAPVRPQGRGGPPGAVSVLLATKVARPRPVGRRRDRLRCRLRPPGPTWRPTPRPLKRQHVPTTTTQPPARPRIRIAKLVASADAELVAELPTTTALIEVEVAALIMNLRRFAALEARLERVVKRVEEQLGHQVDEAEWFALVEGLGVSLVRPLLERLAQAHPDELSRSA
jgi:hypothetical protein